MQELKCVTARDTISRVLMSGNDLVAASWDGKLYGVCTESDTLRWECQLEEHLSEEADPIIDVCSSESCGYVCGAASGSLYRVAVGEDSVHYEKLGEHFSGVSRVCESKGTGWLVSSSYDKTVRVWDLREAKRAGEKKRVELPRKAFCMDVCGNKIVVGMSHRLVHVYDIRNLSKVWQKRASSLKHVTRDIKCMPSNRGYICCSIEGRVAVEYFDPSEKVQQLKYAFKCHRRKVQGVDHIYSVNCLLFHPRYDTFASAGADGTVNIWDPLAKKRTKQIAVAEDQGVTAIGFNRAGQRLAIATGYSYEFGETQNFKRPKIFVRTLVDTDCLPKGVNP